MHAQHTHATHLNVQQDLPVLINLLMHHTTKMGASGMAMLAGLRDMHTLGLIHRDVKPANFGVSPPGYLCAAGEDFEGEELFVAACQALV